MLKRSTRYIELSAQELRTIVLQHFGMRSSGAELAFELIDNNGNIVPQDRRLRINRAFLTEASEATETLS